jgi:hypothetical protein
MNDQDLNALLSQARAAGERVDLSAREYGFETRMAATLAGLPLLAGAGGVSSVQVIWRMAAGCAALVGVMAVWFVLVQSSTETEDDLTAFWDSGPVPMEMMDADFAN